MSEYHVEIKDLIEVIRIQRNIKLVDFEKATGLSKMTIRKINNGCILNVKVESLALFMRYIIFRMKSGKDLNNQFMAADSAFRILNSKLIAIVIKGEV